MRRCGKIPALARGRRRRAQYRECFQAHLLPNDVQVSARKTVPLRRVRARHPASRVGQLAEASRRAGPDAREGRHLQPASARASARGRISCWYFVFDTAPREDVTPRSPIVLNKVIGTDRAFGVVLGAGGRAGCRLGNISSEVGLLARFPAADADLARACKNHLALRRSKPDGGGEVYEGGGLRGLAFPYREHDPSGVPERRRVVDVARLVARPLRGPITGVAFDLARAVPAARAAMPKAAVNEKTNTAGGKH